MDAFTLLAPAKLNLFLHITGKRPDGYHTLESLVAFTDIGDQLEFSHADTLTLEITGPFARALQDTENNLVMRAARLVQSTSHCSKGAKIALHKSLPVGAGIGGGSSDAAAAIKGLCQLWDVAFDPALALQLGSDVPVCVQAHPAWMRGIGEDITPVAMACGIAVVLLNPNQPLLTADVFRRFTGSFTQAQPLPAIATPEELFNTLRTRQNDLQSPAIAALPVIADLLAALEQDKNCRLARMSGSGATCFGLYDNDAQAALAARALQHAYPHFWCVAARIEGAL